MCVPVQVGSRSPIIVGNPLTHSTAPSVDPDKGRSPPTGHIDLLPELQQWVEMECHGDTPLGRARPVMDKLLASGSDHTRSKGTREALVGVVSLIREAHAGRI